VIGEVTRRVDRRVDSTAGLGAEGVGKATGEGTTRGRGRTDETSSNLKQAGEDMPGSANSAYTRDAVPTALICCPAER
jgi:uncharacterized protein YjbJ (UPF0337 family)